MIFQELFTPVYMKSAQDFVWTDIYTILVQTFQSYAIGRKDLYFSGKNKVANYILLFQN